MLSGSLQEHALACMSLFLLSSFLVFSFLVKVPQTVKIAAVVACEAHRLARQTRVCSRRPCCTALLLDWKLGILTQKCRLPVFDGLQH